MGKLVKGDIVIIPFPFTDLSDSKKRPAFVVSDLGGDDIIVCQITSKSAPFLTRSLRSFPPDFS